MSSPPIVDERRLLLDVRDLQTWFPVRSGLLQRVTSHVKAVDGVSFEIREGETKSLNLRVVEVK